MKIEIVTNRYNRYYICKYIWMEPEAKIRDIKTL